MTKKLLTLVLALVLAMAMSSMALAEFRVALLNKQDTNEYLCAIFDKLQSHFTDGDGFEVVRYDADGDSSAQLQQMEDVLLEGVDAIVVCPMDAETLASACVEANEENVPVIAMDIMLTPGTCNFTFVGSNNYNLAYAQATWMIEHMPENARIILYRFTPGSETSNNRYQGVIDALEQSGRTDYEIVQTIEFNASQEDSQSKMEDCLQVVGDNFDVIIGPSDAYLYGAIAAMEAAGIDVESKLTVGFDAEDAMIQLINEGKVDMSLKQGQSECAQMVYDLLCGYRDGVDNTPEDAIEQDGATLIYIPGVPVDSTNVADYLN